MTEADLLRYIRDEVQESLTLDYKDSRALTKTDPSRNEISKDVSAFANAAGGRIIYGITESGHLPTGLDDGVDPTVVSREWLEQVINSRIEQRIEGVAIHQVPISKNAPARVAYVVDVPQSARAPHMASDHKYYKRFNFLSVPMEEYEVRDVMNRVVAPALRLNLELMPGLRNARPFHVAWNVAVRLLNEAPTPADYAVIHFAVLEPTKPMEPADTLPDPLAITPIRQIVDFGQSYGAYHVYEVHRMPSRDLPIWAGLTPLVLAIDIDVPADPTEQVIAFAWLLASPRMKNVVRGVTINTKGEILHSIDGDSFEQVIRQMWGSDGE